MFPNILAAPWAIRRWMSKPWRPARWPNELKMKPFRKRLEVRLEEPFQVFWTVSMIGYLGHRLDGYKIVLTSACLLRSVVECSCISCGGSSSSSVHPEPVLKKKKMTLATDTKENQPQSPKKAQTSGLDDCGFSLEPEPTPKMEFVPHIWQNWCVHAQEKNANWQNGNTRFVCSHKENAIEIGLPRVQKRLAMERYSKRLYSTTTQTDTVAKEYDWVQSYHVNSWKVIILFHCWVEHFPSGNLEWMLQKVASFRPSLW